MEGAERSLGAFSDTAHAPPWARLPLPGRTLAASMGPGGVGSSSGQSWERWLPRSPALPGRPPAGVAASSSSCPELPSLCPSSCSIGAFPVKHRNPKTSLKTGPQAHLGLRVTLPNPTVTGPLVSPAHCLP